MGTLANGTDMGVRTGARVAAIPLVPRDAYFFGGWWQAIRRWALAPEGDQGLTNAGHVVVPGSQP